MQQLPIDILFVGNQSTLLEYVQKTALKHSLKLQSASIGKEAMEIMENPAHHVKIVISEIELKDFSGLQLLEWIQSQSPKTLTILIAKNSDQSLQAIKMGAYEFLITPSQEKIEKIINKAIDQEKLFERLNSFDEEHIRAENRIIGKSPKMQAVFEMIRHVSSSSCTVLILGESGTGKEMVAQAIHRNSPRKDKPFVVINCAAMPETLLESELFGYVKGAFTGANQDKKGLFEAAHGGTVFLDEIGEVSLSTQVKLLRVLQGGEIQPVGSPTSRQVDVRILAATNKDLFEMTKTGDFREDLYYRLNVVTIGLPALRERKEDIHLLTWHLLGKLAEKIGKKVDKIAIDVIETFKNYDWPGNVRELENTIERAIVLAENNIITAKHLSAKILSQAFYQASKDESDLTQFSYKEAKKRALNNFNHSYILGVLEKSKGNITLASEIAQMDRSNFKKILKKAKIANAK